MLIEFVFSLIQKSWDTLFMILSDLKDFGIKGFNFSLLLKVFLILKILEKEDLFFLCSKKFWNKLFRSSSIQNKWNDPV